MQIILMVSISNNSSGISFVCLQHKLSVYVNIGLIHRLHLHQSTFPILCCSSASLSSEESSSLPDELKLLSQANELAQNHTALVLLYLETIPHRNYNCYCRR